LHILKELLANFPLVASLSGMLLAQFLKIPYYYIIDKKLNWKHLFESGGMPSSHSAMSGALAVAIGITQGWESGAFAISVAFASIVMYDAVGVRRATGKQSLLLNRILEESYKTGRMNIEKLHEYTGHTPFEVLGGLILGILVALALNYGGYHIVS